jgi:hypothetical protein
MSEIPVRIFVNERPLTVPAGSTVGSALRLFDAALASRVAAGAASVTDGRGLPLTPDSVLSAGAILRIVGAGSAGRAGSDALH